ncbi:MAG: efflux RND transporter periplasmic adaptor subunit [Victivallaceae bacterium]|nr:efflux RND transporter periplasmic adaptor subunit [Victivallaceae bacterium]
MKRAVYIFLAVTVAVVAVLVALKLFSGGETQQKKDAERLAIATVQPERKQLADIRSFTGTLKPDSTFDLAAKVPGKLLTIRGSLGDPLTPGQEIAKIDDVEYIQALQQSKADLETGKAQLLDANISLEQAERDFDRYRKLHDSKVYSDAQYDLAMSTLNSKRAIAAMRAAEVARLQAAADNAATRLDDTDIRAEWADGTRFIARRFVDPGALIAANQPLMTVIDIAALKAEINVIERDYPKLKLQHPAVLTTDAYPEKSFTGYVANISQNLDANTRQAPVQIKIPNAAHELKPGMFVRVNIEFSRHDNALTLPREAFVKRQNREGVFVYLKDEGLVRFVPTTVGLTVGNNVEVVAPDDIKLPVVTLGNHQLFDGALVIDPAAAFGTAETQSGAEPR